MRTLERALPAASPRIVIPPMTSLGSRCLRGLLAPAFAVVLIASCTSGSAAPSASQGVSFAPVSATPASSVAEPMSGAAVPGAVPAQTSADVPSPPPPATPTPTPDPAVWRYEGVVVDAQGSPIPDVCVIIGPVGCKQYSPHTDDRGVYYFDVPQNATVVYDLTFIKEGYTPVFHRAQPSEPTVFNVILPTAK